MRTPKHGVVISAQGSVEIRHLDVSLIAVRAPKRFVSLELFRVGRQPFMPVVLYGNGHIARKRLHNLDFSGDPGEWFLRQMFDFCKPLVKRFLADGLALEIFAQVFHESFQ